MQGTRSSVSETSHLQGCKIIHCFGEKGGWIVGNVFINTSSQLVPTTAAATLVCTSYTLLKIDDRTICAYGQ
jgi:hypothetical protein